MAEIVHVYRCLTCGYEIEVRITQSFECPACKRKPMCYMTSRPKK